MILGGATILVGLSLLFSKKKVVKGCKSPKKSHIKKLLPNGLFFMGVGMALNPCAPLGKVMLAASATTSAMVGSSLGLGFGLGAVLVPAVVFGVGMAYIGAQLREQLAQWQTILEKTSAILLIILGAGVFIF